MTWYEKYKDTELMKEFKLYFIQNNLMTGGILEMLDIKDIWGYLICFAETKGIIINNNVMKIDSKKHFIVNTIDIKNVLSQDESDNYEQAMLWCADKFFEVAK